MTETILFRLRGEIILVFHIQHASRLHPNHRWRVVASIAKFRFAGDRLRCCLQRDRRACLWQFRKHSVLPTGRGDKQPDACYPARGAECEFLKHLHKTFFPMVVFRSRAFTSTPTSFSSALITAEAFSSPKPSATADSRLSWTTRNAGI